MRGAGEGEERAISLGKKPRMRQGILLFLLAGVMLSCLGVFPSLAQTAASEAPYAAAGAQEGSYAPPLEALTAPQGRNNKKDKPPVNASVPTLLVLAMASSFGASQGAIRSCGLQGGGDRRWSAAGREGPSCFLGVFRL